MHVLKARGGLALTRPPKGRSEILKRLLRTGSAAAVQESRLFSSYTYLLEVFASSNQQFTRFPEQPPS